MAVNPIVVIPARMGSSRLPGKPLALIGGRPMIVHVLDAARAAGIGPVAVACAEPEIAHAVRAAGGTAVMTDPHLPRGSDRVAAALATLDPHGEHDVVVNLQGDLPSIPPGYLRAVLEILPGFDITTLVTAATAEDVRSHSVPKVACSFAAGEPARALYFSRAAIPHGGPFWHHVGLYAFHRAALARFVSLPEGGLEQSESLEQLRALEAGMSIGCARVDHAPYGVDTPADLERARRELA